MTDEVSKKDLAAEKARKEELFRRMFGAMEEIESAPEEESVAIVEDVETPQSTPEPPAPTPVAPEPEASVASEPVVEEPQPVEPTVAAEEDDAGFWRRLRKGLGKTRQSFGKGLADLLVGAKEIDDEIFEEIETQLLLADVGVEATDIIIESLTERVGRKELIDAGALFDALKQELRALLDPVDKPFTMPEDISPYVMLVVGVNGVGKTTTIGKLAMRLRNNNKSVLLAAGDTFRAAAVEQLQVWGERNGIGVIAQRTGADSASVVYDGVQAAKAREVDVLIADTAGRLHTRANLMEELTKVTRVMKKQIPEAPHEVLLVLDAGTGQNAINQALQFSEAVGVTGLVLTKLDGTAKGGILFALAQRTGLPIRFIGVGEQLEDLRPFDADEFVEALFDDVVANIE